MMMSIDQVDTARQDQVSKARKRFEETKNNSREAAARTGAAAEE
jgi:hypothetical protein